MRLTTAQRSTLLYLTYHAPWVTDPDGNFRRTLTSLEKRGLVRVTNNKWVVTKTGRRAA